MLIAVAPYIDRNHIFLYWIRKNERERKKRNRKRKGVNGGNLQSSRRMLSGHFHQEGLSSSASLHHDTLVVVKHRVQSFQKAACFLTHD